MYQRFGPNVVILAHPRKMGQFDLKKQSKIRDFIKFTFFLMII